MKNFVFLSKDLPEALKTLQNLDVPIKSAYKIAKIVDELVVANKRYDQLREKIAQKYCIRREADDVPAKEGEPPRWKKNDPVIENQSYTFTEANRVKFEREFGELLVLDVDVKEKLKIADLGDARLKTRELLLLEFLFEDLNLQSVKSDNSDEKKE